MAFKIHPQENNKDQRLVDELHAIWNSKKRVFKNYQRGANSTDTQKKINPFINDMYYIIVKKVKELYSTLPAKEDRVMIELNLQSHPGDVSGLYCICTSTFFFHLECDVMSNYKIEYQLHECPFEEEILALMKKYSVRSYSTEIMKQPDYPAFFQRALRAQPDHFIHLL